MIAELQYRLCGYIPYTTSSLGFVTPVFKDEKGEPFVQISSGVDYLPEWEVLPEWHRDSVIAVDSELKAPDSFVYGFKKGDSLYFARGEEMAARLSGLFQSAAEEGYDLAKNFTEDWPLLEPNVRSLSKEEIWKQCLDFIAERSKAMPGIFSSQFEVADYRNATLTLRSANDSARRVFETKFKDQLRSHFGKIVPHFQIKFANDSDSILTPLPFVYFGIDEFFPSQNSFFVETRISRFQDFDNFIVTSFNSRAFQHALRFIENERPTLLTIQGAPGVGKTHLAHAIAKRLSNSQKKVAVFTVFLQSDANLGISESEIIQLEEAASRLDVIIIDDVDNINKRASSIRGMDHLLKKWLDMNKSVILSYRDGFHIDIIRQLQHSSEHLYLSLPDRADKLTIIESKTNDLNIQLPKWEKEKLAQDDKVSIADIQKLFVKTYLTEELKSKTKNIFFPYDVEHIQPKWIESYVFNYFNLNMTPSGISTSRSISTYAKLISHFMQDIFAASHHKSLIAANPSFIDGLYYSFDTLQRYVFENKNFRSTLSDILVQLVLKDKRDNSGWFDTSQ